MPFESEPDPAGLRASELSRDIARTAFTEILEGFLARETGAVAAALVDPLGETVDYAGSHDPFETRVAAAHIQILLAAPDCVPTLGETQWIAVRARKRGMVGVRLPEGYVLLVLLGTRATFRLSRRAVSACLQAIADEAGWAMPPDRGGLHPAWSAVRIESDHNGRPLRLAEHSASLEIIGAITGLSPGETGYRVRTREGAERTVIREPSGVWYVDVPI